MTVAPEAYFIAGVLAADGSLRPDLTVDETMEALARLVGPSTVWCTTLPAQEGWDAFDQAVDRPPALWSEPDPQVAEAVEPVLLEGWGHVDRLRNRPSYIRPMLRVMTHSAGDAALIRQLGSIGDMPVGAFLRAQLGPWAWRWPLRVGVVAPDSDATVKALEGNGYYLEHYELRQVSAGQHEPLDLLVVDGRVADSIVAGDLGVVGAAIVTRPPGDQSNAAASSVVDAVEPGAVVDVFGDELGWFENFVAELSHDRPLDAAVSLTASEALVVGDPEFISVTSIRNWARLVADDADLRDDPSFADQLRWMVAEVEFEHERGGGRDLGGAVRDREEDGSVVELQGSAAVRMAGGGGLEELDAASPEATGDTGPVDDRRMITKVTDARGGVRTNGFVAGRVHKLHLRVAATARDGETAASETLPSPDPGTTVELDVTVHVEGARKRLPSVVLVHPATGDGDWTKTPVSFTAPRRDGDLRLFITVEWRGRVIQSATLSGPLHDPGDAEVADAEFLLDVDQSAGVSGLGERTRADATIIQVPSTSRRPAILDASSVVSIDPAQLQRANRQVRKALIESFLRPPASLADAADVLINLALRGSLLRDALRGKDQSFFDDAEWVHVMSFGGPPINYELIYTHPMPKQKPIEVCGPALSGASECGSGCAERDRDDRVCPFGFWATSKVVERRLHSAGRNDSSASDARVVQVRDGGVAAVTDAANSDGDDAAGRIGEAVTAFVHPGTAVEASSWTSLEAAMETPKQFVCLVTHTIEPDEPEDPDDVDDLAVELQLGAETQLLYLVDQRYVNPELRTPGPVVLALGCDTATISASFASFVSRLHSLGAEIVVSAISQIPGKEAADFVERFTVRLDEQLRRPGEHRFGEVMTAVRAQTLLQGDVLALALTASGDGDVKLAGAS